MPRPLLSCLAVFIATAFVSASVIAQAPVEPVLQKYCLGCHNQNDKEAGLSLQTLDDLKKGSENGEVLNRSDLSKSLLLAVLKKDSDQTMPPEGEPQPTDAERKLLQQWVLAGASMKSIATGIPDVPDMKPIKKSGEVLLASTVLPGGVRAVVAGNRHVSLIDIATQKRQWTTNLDQGKIAGLYAANKNPWIVAAVGTPGVDGAAVILSVKDGSIVKKIGRHTDALYSAVLNHDETLLATAGYDRRILIHDLKSGDVLQRLDGHNGSVFSLSFDPTGQVLCSASADGTVKVWNVKTGERLDTLSQPRAEQYTVIVSHDGQKIFAAGADNRIRVWQLLSRDRPRINPQLVSRFAHEQPISRLGLSADGSRLASVAEDGTIRTWSTTPLEPIESLPQQNVAVTSLSFVSTKLLLVTRIDGSIETFRLKTAANKATPADAANMASTANIMLPEALNELTESTDANDDATSSQAVELPAKIAGVIKPDGGNDRDVDCFRFTAKAGQRLLFEVNARRMKSPLDSKIEILTADGAPVLRTRLQAVRDSYFTFRGKDSTTSGDFRVFNWQEMELNEFIYSDGEVNRLWLYPRGPDSGFTVYPGFGSRHAYFGTTPTSHALQAPCFIVVPRGVNEQITANGLPVFPIYYANDDDGLRELGSDSRLHFTAPADGDYVVRIGDARGFSGPDFKYELTVRSPRPNYSVKVSTKKITVSPGTGREIMFTAKRIDGYAGPIMIDVEQLPAGFGFSGPIEIQAQQYRASGTLFALADAKEPTPEELAKIQLVAHAPEGTGLESAMNLGGLDELKVQEDVKLKVAIRPSNSSHLLQEGVQEGAEVDSNAGGLLLQIYPGQTIQASVELERLKHDGVVSFGKEDSGRNLPHGVFVDNIGLNGLMLLEKQSQRDFFITAAKWVPPSKSTFFLKSNVDSATSLPVTLEVLPPKGDDGSPNVTATGN